MRTHQCARLRFGAFLLLPCALFSSLSAYAQLNSGNRSRQVQIEVTIRDSSDNFISVPASVKLFLNGVPCGDTIASNGHASLIANDIGKFTVVVSATGYKQGQNELSVSEPVTAHIEVTLQPDTSSLSPTDSADVPLLAPKAKDALDKARQFLRDGNLDEAEKALARAGKLAPNDPQVLYVQGLFDMRKHDWSKAQAALEKVVQMRPNSTGALSALGMALCNQKKYADAIPPLEKSLELDPTEGWQTRWSLAESYYQNKRFDEALKTSLKAEAASQGTVPQVDLLLARSLTAVGRYDDSARVLREFLQTHSGPAAATARHYLDRLIADGKVQRQ